MAESSAGPLQGVRVVDFSRVLSGPFATLLLADMGAEVIKVERTGQGDETRWLPPAAGDLSHYFASVNRGKKSVQLDLADAGDRQLARQLMVTADVVVENFRPGVGERLGVDHASVAVDNPGVVYCSISSFGQDSDLSVRPAYDLVLQAATGLLSITGAPDGPPVKVGVPICDLAAGMFAAVAIVGALYRRRDTGEGCHLDTSMFDAGVSLLTYLGARHFLTGEVPGRMGNGHPSVVPYGELAAADGALVVAVLGEQFWPPLCRAVGRPDLETDPRFATNPDRIAHRAELEALLGAIFATRTVAEWQSVLVDHDVPHAPIADLGTVLSSDAFEHSGLRVPVTGPGGVTMDVIGTAARAARTGRSAPDAVPGLGEHDDEVLGPLRGA